MAHAGQRAVVVTDHRDVAGEVRAEAGEPVEQANRAPVVRGDHGGRVAVEESGRGPDSRFLGVVTGDDADPVGQTVPAHGAPVAATPVGRDHAPATVHERARAVGVPVERMKIALFMGVGLLAWFTGMIILFQFNTIQSGQGVGNEFVYIIAAVAGGCLLTGGYGSAVGAGIGALIFGMVNQGIVYAGWDPDWFTFFVGALLLGAILLNTFIRRRAEANR